MPLNHLDLLDTGEKLQISMWLGWERISMWLGVAKDFWGCLLLVGNAGGLAAICVANSDIRSYPKLD